MELLQVPYLQYKKKAPTFQSELLSGGRGIRTPGDREASTVFKTAAFDHSAIPPKTISKNE